MNEGRLVSQASAAPTRKIGTGVAAYGGVSSAMGVSLILYGMAKYYGGADSIPQDDLVIAPVFASILTTVVNVICGWATKDRAP